MLSHSEYVYSSSVTKYSSKCGIVDIFFWWNFVAKIGPLEKTFSQRMWGSMILELYDFDGTAILENCMAVTYKIKHGITTWASNSTHSYLLKTWKYMSIQNVCIPIIHDRQIWIAAKNHRS